MSKVIKSALAPYAAIFGLGYMGYMLLPALLSALIGKFDLSASNAGFAATVLLGALAMSMFIVAPFLSKIESLKLTRWAAIITIIGYCCAAFAPSYATALFCLVIAGSGMGAAIAGGDAMISATPNPDQIFARIFAAGQLSAFLLLVAIIPMASSALGHSGILFVLMIWSLLMLGLLLISKEPATKLEGDSHKGSLLLFLSPIVLALFAIGFSDASVWPFTGEIGASLGLIGGDAEAIQGIALFAGIFGALLASFLGTRMGRRVPIIVGIMVLGLMYFLILNAPTAPVYITAQIVGLFIYGFTIPYLFGVCSELDSSGQIMATASGMQMLGIAIAPWISGIIISGAGRSAVSYLVIATCALTLVLALTSLNRLKQNSTVK